MIKLWKKKPISLEEAPLMYERQVSSIKSISDTLGFQEMVAWWEREYERVDNLIDSSEPVKLEVLRIERSLIKKHLVWLNNLQNVQLDKSKPASD